MAKSNWMLQVARIRMFGVTDCRSTCNDSCKQRVENGLTMAFSGFACFWPSMRPVSTKEKLTRSHVPRLLVFATMCSCYFLPFWRISLINFYYPLHLTSRCCVA